MVSFPNAKINLGLRVTRKRADGYHDLETIFLPIAIHDALETLPAEAGQPTSITESGLRVPGDPQRHLCIRAWHLLHQRHPELPAVHMHLHKTIPMGAGMGGGSADGAFTLRQLNQQFQLGHSSEELSRFALELGSDCPFFIYNKPCLARGRGELLTPVNLELPNCELLVIHPGIHVSTQQAFSGIIPSDEGASLEELIRLPVSEWRDRIRNDFEATVFTAQPEIRNIRDLMYLRGAIYASMTGSGSAVYGIFEGGKVPELTPEPGWSLFRPALLA